MPQPVDPLALKTVSLSMQNARIGQLLWPLSTDFGISLSIDPLVLEMTQVSNLHLQKVNGRQALNHILSTFDVAGVLGPDNVLVVSMMEERTFDIEMLAGKTSINVGVGGDVFGSSGKDSGVKDSLSLSGDFGDKADGIDHLVKSVEAILAEEQGSKDTREKGRYTVDRGGGILYVRARPSKMRAIEKFVAQGKVFRARQVQIDAQLIDVQLALVAGLAALVVLACLGWSRSLPLRRLTCALLHRTPIVKGILTSSGLAFFAEYLAILTRSGLDIISSFRILERSVRDLYYKERVVAIQQFVERGDRISVAMRQVGGFPAMMVRMIAVGEDSGTLDRQLSYLSTEYSTRLKRMVDTIAEIIKPLVVIVAGGVFLLLIVALLLPVYDLVRQTMSGPR